MLATLAGRRASRLYALALAPLVTLAIDPAIAADVGWQLSFAAVLGILVLASPLRRAIAGRIGERRRGPRARRGRRDDDRRDPGDRAADRLSLRAVSTTTLVANLLALPAVAPAMWLGMLAAAAGPGPGLPGRAAQRAQRPAARLHRPGRRLVRAPEWAEVEVRLGAGCWTASSPTARRLARRRPAARLAKPRRRGSAVRPRVGGGPRAESAGQRRCGRRLALAEGSGRAGRRRRAGLRVSVLDVGQGDAILLQPAGAPAVLVDGGPPGADLERKLEQAGVERLGAAIVTHDQSDHAGGIEELLGRLPVDRLVYARLGPRPGLRGAAAAGCQPRRGRGRRVSCAPAGCASRSSGRRASCSTGRVPGPTRTSWRWSC